jgi:hypothetical protein
MLARMHLAGAVSICSSPICAAWPGGTRRCRGAAAPDRPGGALRAELAYQNHVAASPAYAALPRGPVHADLFRDNVMFEGEQLTGFFDFYFAGVDTWLFDLAVCLNDWCVDLPTGAHNGERASALLGLRAVRPAHGGRAQPAAGHGAPERCASGSRACGTGTCRAKPNADAARPPAFRARAAPARRLAAPISPPRRWCRSCCCWPRCSSPRCISRCATASSPMRPKAPERL